MRTGSRVSDWHDVATLYVLWDRDILAFFLIGMLLFGLGLVGEYVGRIYQQVRERPRYTVRAVLEDEDTAAGNDPRTMTRAVVFAYHNVGVRCLKVLLAHGVDVPFVVTHSDDPRETQLVRVGGGSRRRSWNRGDNAG